MNWSQSGSRGAALATSLTLVLSISGCTDANPFLFGKKAQPADTQSTALESNSSVRLVERDVEAPDVFDVTEEALWDGRPSLGGVWVAYPNNVQPERVIIRNTENNKFVIGALFKRERDNPGPKIQLSSDAAAALGILAGNPTMLSVTALRRQTVAQTPATPPVAGLSESKKGPGSTDSTKINAKPLDPIAAASAAIDKVESRKAAAKSLKATAKPAVKAKPAAKIIPAAQIKPAPRSKPATKPAPKPKPAPGLAKPFIQIGIFTVESNAQNTAASLRAKGVLPTVRAQENKGKKFWRVLIGPTTNKSERETLRKKAEDLGFGDAYYVSN